MAERFEPFVYITSHPQGLHTGKVEPTPEFVREVEHALTDSETQSDMAQWIADRIEEYGAQDARPVFDLEGCGPFCSYCGAIGGLCGHPERATNAATVAVLDD